MRVFLAAFCLYIVTTIGAGVKASVTEINPTESKIQVRVLPFPVTVYTRADLDAPRIGAVAKQTLEPTVSLLKFAEFFKVPLVTPAYGSNADGVATVGVHKLKSITVTYVAVDIFGEVTIRYEVEYADYHSFVHIAAPIEKIEKAKFSWAASKDYVGFANDPKRPSALNTYVQTLRTIFAKGSCVNSFAANFL